MARKIRKRTTATPRRALKAGDLLLAVYGNEELAELAELGK